MSGSSSTKKGPVKAFAPMQASTFKEARAPANIVERDPADDDDNRFDEVRVGETMSMTQSKFSESKRRGTLEPIPVDSLRSS